MKRRGPSTDPWGTPCDRGAVEEVQLFMLLSVKGFLRHEPSESNGNTKVFEKCSLNHGKWGNIPKQNNEKFRNHKPCNLCKGNGKG